MEDEKEIKKDEVKVRARSWGARINVPTRVMEHLKVAVGDELTWKLTESEGKSIVVLSKEE